MFEREYLTYGYKVNISLYFIITFDILHIERKKLIFYIQVLAILCVLSF